MPNQYRDDHVDGSNDDPREAVEATEEEWEHREVMRGKAPMESTHRRNIREFGASFEERPRPFARSQGPPTSGSWG